MPAAVLEVRLGDRSRRPEVLRRGAVGPRGQGGARRSPTARWVLLYVKRWLAAPLQHPDGTLEQRDKGTPQGSAVSPILANLFMHYAFDTWMARKYPGLPVRALRRRCRRALQEQAAGRGRAGRDRRADGGGGLAASPRQDEDRLLQGRQASGRARAHLVHLPRVRLPATGGARQERRELHRRSCPRSAPRRSRPKAPSSARCGSTGAPTCRWTTWRDG